jgi:hypothetical protein
VSGPGLKDTERSSMIGITFSLGRVIYATGNTYSEVQAKLRGALPDQDFQEGADVIFITGVSTGGLLDVTHVSDFPEHEKLQAVADESQAVGEFLDIGLAQQGLVLAEYHEGSGLLYPSHRTVEDVLASYFGIDRDRLEAEKRQMLEMLRDANQAREDGLRD